MGSQQPQQRLYILDTDLSHPATTRRGRILSCLPDGSDLQVVIDHMDTMPDGIAIDHSSRQMYWTNMGPDFKTDCGSIERAELAGSNRTVIIPPGRGVGTFTPKQIAIAKKSRKLYWCDREGMKVMRANLDGGGREVLVSTGDERDAEQRRDQMRWCVGVAVDERRGFFYWTQKGPSKGNQGRILRAPISAPEGKERSVEVVFENLPEPIDLDMDEETGTLYWTDRGDPPRGNSLNRAVVSEINGDGQKGQEPEILAVRLHETIGLTLDKEVGVAYVADLAGGVYSVDVRTKKKTILFAELGDTTGIVLA